MIRTYCDMCDRELFGDENRVSHRIKRALGDVRVEVHVGTSEGRVIVWNRGHVCAECVLKTVAQGADL